MAAKPKLSPDQWELIRHTWETDARKPLAWLIKELDLPVSAEALRLRAKGEKWEKGGAAQPSAKLAKSSKLAKVKPKLGNAPKPKLAPGIPSLEKGAGGDAQDAGEWELELSKAEHESPAPLEPREERFVGEYLIDLNGKQAAIRAGYSPKTAASIASQLLIKLNVQAAIAVAQAERAKRTGIDADRALQQVWDVATADRRELTQVKVDCCRHCHGENHKRQRTVGEMNLDRENHAAKAVVGVDFDEEGGIGFNPLRPPHPDCPDCGGDGHAREVVKDTRHYSPQAVALYEGVKRTKYGLEIQMSGKMGAMDMVFKHLGLYEQDNKQKTEAFTSLDALRAFADRMDASRKRQYAMLEERRQLGLTGD